MNRIFCFTALFTSIFSLILSASAAERYTVTDLLSMNIEDLINVRVTSLSKHEEKYMSTAGAIFVITNDDIRRSGARSIPEALRLAPGLQVSQSNMNQYQIGIRGQSDFFTDLLLVMVDGRPIYTTTFSGVWWVAQNYPLEDIERIEVIRGPGGAIWGSNAVNGVINVITRSATDTAKGLRITGGGGTEDRGFGTISYSSEMGNVDYRVYAMNEVRDGGVSNRTLLNYYDPALPAHTPKIPPAILYDVGDDTPDSRRLDQQGFRLDWQADEKSRFTLHGDSYRVKTGYSMYRLPIIDLTTPHFIENYIGSSKYTGNNLVFRMEKEILPDITFKGQLLYDQYRIRTEIIRENKNTYDGEVQFDFANIMNQHISIGANYRQMRSSYENTLQFQMPNRTTDLTSFFINDELSLLDGHLRLIAGVKLERNSYTKWISQPSVRAVYSDDHFALWAAASRSARTPNDMENGVRWYLRATGGSNLQQTGDGRAQTEKVNTVEIGARLRPTEESLIELTAFRIFYKGVLDTWQDRSPAVMASPIRIIPEYLTNVLNGYGEGFEANFRFQPKDWITLKGSWTYLHQNYVDHPIQDNETKWTVLTNKYQDPLNRFHAGLSLNPLENVEFDANLYFNSPFRDGTVRGYHKLDLRLGWRPSNNLEISLVGQDLIRATHLANEESIMGYESRIQQRYYVSAKYTYE